MEKMLLLQRLDSESLEEQEEVQNICIKIERSSYMGLNIQEINFQIDMKLKEVSISEERSSSNSAILM